MMDGWVSLTYRRDLGEEGTGVLGQWVEVEVVYRDANQVHDALV